MGIERSINAEGFNQLFPFHFTLDQDLKVTGAGKALLKFFPNLIGEKFSDKFVFKRPTIGIRYAFDSISEYTNQIIILQLKQGKETDNMLIRGQVLVVKDRILFVGSPWVTKVEDLDKFGLQLTDFAVHDPVTDLLNVLNVNQLAFEDSQNQRIQLEKKNKEIADLARFPSENPNPIFRISHQGKILYANQACSSILKEWQSEEGEECPPTLKAHLSDALQNDQQIEIDLPVGRSHFSFQITPVVDDRFVNVYARDVTEKREAERVLKESEERYKQLVEDASDIIYRTNFEGNFVYANPVAMRILEAKEDDITNRHFTDLVREDWRPKVAEFYRKQILDKEPLTYFEFPIINFEGKEIWLGQNVKTLKEGQKIVGFQAVARDVTERRQMEENLQEAKVKAEDSLQFKEQFLANMSHEIRTPMNGILGMSKLLASAKLSDKQRGYLNSIQMSAGNLLVIINDILDLSKIEAGKLELEKVGFRLTDLVTNAVTGIEYLAAEKDLLLTGKVDASLQSAILLGDPVRLGQVLTNLLSNAIKFSERGEIKLHCSELSATSEALKIRFLVADTGIGIPKDRLDKIFENFEQVDASITRKYGGTGLGLSISKLLVDLHDGQLQVESEEGKGSKFFFDISFPLGTEADIPANVQMETASHDISGVRVLLVEDHYVNQVYATSMLEKEKAVVELAENGAEAIEKLKKHSYDIVLMDNQMPVMGGIEATGVIRNELKLKIPIIAITANAFKGDDKTYLQAGMDAYISKPFKDTELIAKIGKLLEMPATDYAPAADEEPTELPVQKLENQKLYDLSNLEAMSRGRQEFVDRMTNMFLQETPKSLESLNRYMDENNHERVKAVIHRMIPSVKMMNIHSILNEMDLIEEYAEKEINLDQLPQLVNKVNEVCGAVLTQLKQA